MFLGRIELAGCHSASAIGMGGQAASDTDGPPWPPWPRAAPAAPAAPGGGRARRLGPQSTVVLLALAGTPRPRSASSSSKAARGPARQAAEAGHAHPLASAVRAAHTLSLGSLLSSSPCKLCQHSLLLPCCHFAPKHVNRRPAAAAGEPGGQAAAPHRGPAAPPQLPHRLAPHPAPRVGRHQHCNTSIHPPLPCPLPPVPSPVPHPSSQRGGARGL